MKRRQNSDTETSKQYQQRLQEANEKASKAAEENKKLAEENEQLKIKLEHAEKHSPVPAVAAAAVATAALVKASPADPEYVPLVTQEPTGITGRVENEILIKKKLVVKLWLKIQSLVKKPSFC